MCVGPYIAGGEAQAGVQGTNTSPKAVLPKIAPPDPRLLQAPVDTFALKESLEAQYNAISYLKDKDLDPARSPNAAMNLRMIDRFGATSEKLEAARHPSPRIGKKK